LSSFHSSLQERLEETFSKPIYIQTALVILPLKLVKLGSPEKPLTLLDNQWKEALKVMQIRLKPPTKDSSKSSNNSTKTLMSFY